MAHDHEEPNYIAIWIWLGVLTVVEIGVSVMPVAKALIVVSLIGLAIAKAGLVALYFMHLRFERRTLGLIAITPALLLILLTFAVYPDAMGFFSDRMKDGSPPAHSQGSH